MTQIINIDSHILLRLAADPQLVQEFPALANLARKRSATRVKTCCGGSRTTSLSHADYDEAKRQLANMATESPEVRGRLKTILKADVLKIQYRATSKPGMILKKF